MPLNSFTDSLSYLLPFMFGNVSCYTGTHKLKEDKIAIPWRMMLIFPGYSMNILRSSRFSDNFKKISWTSCDSYQYIVSIWTLEANVFGNNFHRNKRIQSKQVSCTLGPSNYNHLGVVGLWVFMRPDDYIWELLTCLWCFISSNSDQMNIWTEVDQCLNGYIAHIISKIWVEMCPKKNRTFFSRILVLLTWFT